MPSKIIAERASEFAVRIVALCEKLWARSRAAQRIANQLFDAGTSVGANSLEAEGAQTKPDFVATLSVSRKESWESIFWLRLSVATRIVRIEEVEWELDEAHQLRSMITQAIKTAQSSPSRGEP